MTLSPGTRIGPYEIIAAIGKGGMGEVYRARDAKLQRDVAIKILPSLFARDPERLARFEREARTLAALNHPHVAQVYGVVDLPAESGSHALVLEFVDGEDLSERIARTGAIPIDEALPIALQIAEALEAAHEQGIIHRDLKPANIKLRDDGQVKVLDFGLAKALAPVDPAAREVNLENSPTITSPFQMSQLGVILGTAAYMAPEQAKGKPVDKRADIWAFGCVLYEMLTGKRPFAGEDITDTLAAIVRADPDWSALPADTPAPISKLLRRCLEKDRRERLPDIGAARLELKDVSLVDAPPVFAASGVAVPRRRRILPWAIAAAATIAAIGTLAYTSLTRPAPDTRVYKSLIIPPSPLSGPAALRLNVSPDGRRLAFVAPDEAGRTVLWTLPLDGLNAQPLAGTTFASSPFWSPDSRSIAFFAEGKLKRVDASGGAVTTICDASTAPPGTWGPDDVILFTMVRGPIARVPAAGGTPVVVTRVSEGERVHIAPFFLPDGRHFLYTAGSTAGVRRAGIFVASLDSPDAKRLLDVPSNAAYADRHLLFLRDNTLMAQPFDPQTLTLSGTAVPIAEGLQMNLSTGTGAFSVSRSGVLIYQTGSANGTQLTWFGRNGKPQGTLGDLKGYRDLQLSPDGRWASVTVTAGAQSDIWLFDLARNLSRRFTFGEGGAQAAAWSPDGRFVVYAARRGGSNDLYRQPAAGGVEELLLKDDTDKIPLGFTPDGRTLLYRVPRAAAAGEVWLLPLTGERKPRPFMPGNSNQVPAEVSPDGKWLAYVADDTTRRQVYVTSFPANAGKWQVSTEGGDNPKWRADGKELYFSTEDKLMAVDVSASGGEFDMGPVRPLFDVRTPAAGLATRSTYAVTPDGKRFLVNTWDPRTSTTPITLVVNWPASLK